MLEGKMIKRYDKNKVLRALCLFSLIRRGLPSDHFDTLRKTFLMCYGHQEIVTLMNLQDAGLLKLEDKNAQRRGWNFEKIDELFGLVNRDSN